MPCRYPVQTAFVSAVLRDYPLNQKHPMDFISTIQRTT